MARLTFWFSLLFALLEARGAEPKSPKHSTRAPAWLTKVQHSPQQPRSGQAVQVSAQARASVTNITLQYQVVEPGAYIELADPAYKDNWVSIAMQSAGGTQDTITFQVELPATIQKHRRLIRYRLSGHDSSGRQLLAPEPGDASPNYAFFVYDGIPGWTAAIDPRSTEPKLKATLTFPPETMQRVQAYHLLGKRRSIENATWREQSQGKEYKYTGTLVVDGQVFDHVGYRARGGVWRYAMGKNMWKFSLPGDHSLQAKNDFGELYPAAWTKINLRSCIQQGDYGQRGEQGMFESVGFRLFNLAGVAAPNTHWLQLRIIDEAKENPPDQYRGDFWGLYLAIENEDGRFLKAHHLPSGNLFKMMNGSGYLQHHADGGVTNLSDLFGFMGSYQRGNLPDSWWQKNFDLAGYYSFRAICECIHHYDISDGKNYDYYLNPETGRWQIFPWDIDLTWADNMFGNGEDPFKRRVLSHPKFRLEYQNRLRELRDLLFNPEQTGQIIDEYAAVISGPGGVPAIVEADRRKWDYHPVMAMGNGMGMGMGMGMKAGQGLFYEAARSGDFPGMVQRMKGYVKTRGAWIDSVLLNDAAIPDTPKATSCGAPDYASDKLRFQASPYKGANPFAAVKWRLAEVAPHVKNANAARVNQRPLEINAVWESSELTNPADAVAIPAGVAKSGQTYRVRARMIDSTGRCSHWSVPVEFMAR